MASIHDPVQAPTSAPAGSLPAHHVPRQRSLSSASDTSVHSTDSLGDSSHSPEEDEVATLSVSLLDAINAGDRPRLTDLLATASPAAIEQVLATFTYPNTDKYYFHEPEILVDANALLGPSTTRLNLIQIACFLGEEELALDVVNHLAREAESVGSKYALKALLASMWGNGNTTLHLASFLGMAELVAKILEVHPALAKKANDRKVKPVDCTDDDVTRMHFFNTPEVNERIVDNTLRVQSDGALGLIASPTTRGRRSDSSASTTAPSRSILSGSRSTDNLKSISNGHANKKRVSFDPLTLWFQGAEQGDLAQLSLFLPSIESVDARLPSRGATALHLACANGHLNAVKWILDRGADANAADDLGLTALHYAADGLHKELLLALIDDPRVDVDVEDADGEGVLGAIDDEEEGGADLVAKAEVALEVRRTKGPKQGPSAKLAASDLVDLGIPAGKPHTKPAAAAGSAPVASTRVALASSDPTPAKQLTSALKSKPTEQEPDPLSMSAPSKLLEELPKAAMSASAATSIEPPAVAVAVAVKPESASVPTPNHPPSSVAAREKQPILSNAAGQSSTMNAQDPVKVPQPAGISTTPLTYPPSEPALPNPKTPERQPAVSSDSSHRKESTIAPSFAAAVSIIPLSTSPPEAAKSAPALNPASEAVACAPAPDPSATTSHAPESNLSTSPVPNGASNTTVSPTETQLSTDPSNAIPLAQPIHSAPNSTSPTTPTRSPSSSTTHSLANSANSAPTSGASPTGGHNPSVRPPSPYRLDLHPVSVVPSPGGASSLVAAAAAMYEQRTGAPKLPPVSLGLNRAASLSVRSLTSSKPSAAELSVSASHSPASPGPDSPAATATSSSTVSPSGKSRLGVKKEKRASVAASTAAMMANAVERVNSKDGDEADGGVDATPLASVSERRQFWSFATGRPAK